MAAASSTIFIFILLHFAEPILSLCQWTPNDQASVECHLKILDFRRNSSSIAAMQVPHPGLNEAESLGVFCSDVFFFESQLRSDHFGSLDSLANLEISFCQLRTLPPRTFVGLQGLTSLKIHTHNKDWTSLQMEPDYESLVGLEQLQSLDMQLNNLHHIPPGFFCPLKNLAHIELSSNAISDLNHLGISHSSKEEHQEFQCKLHTCVNNATAPILRNSILSSFVNCRHGGCRFCNGRQCRRSPNYESLWPLSCCHAGDEKVHSLRIALLLA